MRIRSRGFNFFFRRTLGGLFALALAAGCASTPEEKKEKQEDKEASTIRLHREVVMAANTPSIGTGRIKVLRSDPVSLTIEKTAFLDEGDLVRARLIDTMGGHAIQLEFTQHGSMLLQMNTAANPGRRVAVWSRWTEGRWLAAPLIPRGIDTGIFAFTPDASREECERIVRGLNNVAIKLKNQPKPPKKPAEPKPGEADAKKAKKAKDAKKPAKKTDEEEMFQ